MHGDQSALVPGETGFVVLPDTSAAARLAARLVTPTQLRHASGRPFLLGDPATDRVLTAETGADRLALVGQVDADPAELRQLLASVTTPAGLTRATGRPGSYCTVGSIGGQVYVSGPAFETRRLWWANIDGVTVISNRADCLARLGDFDVDPTALVLRLLGSTPHPLDRPSLWAEVNALPGDRYLTVDRHGQHSQGTWWQLPAPELDLAAGAAGLREALAGSVRARTATGSALACDLSGGLDSTPLCYFAARAGQGVLARTLYNDDPGGAEDLRWAQKTLDVMPGVHTHLVSTTDALMDFYEGIDGVHAPLDEPNQAVTAGPRIMALLTDDRDRGIGLHLNGLGGDHILRGVEAWEHTLFRTHPWQAWQRARAAHIPEGIPARTTLRQLVDRRAYRQWLRDTAAAALDDRTSRRAVPGLNDWSPPMALPPWLSQAGVDIVRDRVRRALPAAEPLDPTMAGHTDLYFIRDAGRLVRSTAQLGTPLGVAYEAPLLDDGVVEAALAVRREQRDNPLEWKPLMKAAMRGLLPDDYLKRTSKVGGGPQSVRGYRRHYDQLIGLMESGGLFDTGLVDRTRLIESTTPSEWETPAHHIHQAVNAAVFLRNNATHRRQAVTRAALGAAS